VGLNNKITGRASGGRIDVLGVSVPVLGDTVHDGPAVAMVRPEAIVLAPHVEGDAQEGPGVVGSVLAVSFLGAVSRITITPPDGGVLIAQLPTSQAAAFPAGSAVRVSVRPDPVPVQPADSPS
jgi:putative spermidine/putrescine transport system ATP-binding protein